MVFAFCTNIYFEKLVLHKVIICLTTPIIYSSSFKWNKDIFSLQFINDMELYRYPISNFRNSIAVDEFHVRKHIMQYSRYHPWFHSYVLSDIMRTPKEYCKTFKWEYKWAPRKYKCITTTLKLKKQPRNYRK